MQKHEFKDGVLYCGDARELIPAIAPHCFLADPPYGLNGGSGTISKARGKAAYITERFEDTPEYIKQVCVPVIEQCIDRFARGAVTPGGKCAWYYPMPEVLGNFDQPAAAGMCSWGRCTTQPILYYGRDPRLGKAITPISYKLTEKPEAVNHPCPKPLKAWTWLLNKISLEGETVFDPFLGSGTTALAAVRSGRMFLGCEIDERYFEMACRRLDDWYRQGDFFR